MLSGNLGTYIRRKSNGRLPQRNHEKAMALRHVQTGYPIEPRAFTADEVDDYFSGDLLTCLRCGRSMKKLGNHLRQIHILSVPEYQDLYGLPYRRGLVGVASHVAYSQAAKRRMEEDGDWLEEYRDKHRYGKSAPRVQRPYHRKKSVANIATANRGASYNDGDFDAFLARVALGRKPKEVCSDADMPSMSWLIAALSSEPDKRSRYEQVLDGLPFATQAAMEKMGPRFRAEVARLRGDGLSFSKIADKLGVSTMTVHRHRPEVNA